MTQENPKLWGLATLAEFKMKVCGGAEPARAMIRRDYIETLLGSLRNFKEEAFTIYLSPIPNMPFLIIPEGQAYGVFLAQSEEEGRRTPQNPIRIERKGV